MKKIMTWMMGTALLLTACSEQENGAGETGDPIVFASTTTTTRAGSTYVGTGSFDDGACVGVFGYYTKLDPFTDDTFKPDFMYNQPVTRTDGLWEYDPLKYWPNNYNEKVTFCAYYPFDPTAGKGVTGTYGISWTFTNDLGLPHFHFQVQPDSKDEVDLMLSDVRLDEVHRTETHTTSVVYKVPLIFHHALAKVRLMVLNEEGNRIPHSATLTGLCDKGDCAPSTTEPVNWSNVAKSDPPVTFTSTWAWGSEADDDDKSLLLMIPQPLQGEGIKPLLKFDYTYYGNTITAEDIFLDEHGPAEWLPGYTYTYTYRVSHVGNSLSISVEPWYQAGMVFEF